MSKRAPGKFNDDLAAAIYAASLDGGPDEEVGSTMEAPGTWAGLMRDGRDLARALEANEADPQTRVGVTAEELEFLRREGSAGVIITERSDGFVDVAYYDDPAALEKDWRECLEDLAIEEEDFEEEGLEPNATRRRNARLGDVSSRYGAPMGRSSSPVHGNVTLEQVRLDSGGYDTGGAYWGTGEPLWLAEDEDGNQEFLRARDRAAAQAKLSHVTIVRGSSERQNEESKLDAEGTLAQLLEMEAESAEIPADYWAQLEVTPELSAAAVAYENDLWGALSELVRKHPPKGDADANVLMEEGDAPYNVFMTLGGHGVGIWDGSWDEFYDSDVIEKQVRPFLKRKLQRSYETFEQAIMNAAYDNEQRLGIVREEHESNRGRRRRNPQTRWNVYLRGDMLDAVYFDSDMTADEVKRLLVEHDSYDPGIRVEEMPRRRTGMPSRPAPRTANPQVGWDVYKGGGRIDTVYFGGDMSADEVKRSLVDHDGYDPSITVRKASTRRERGAPDQPRPRVQSPYKPGDRVEMHPGTDLWMRGARYGDVVRVLRNGNLKVKLDRLDRLVTVSPDRLSLVE